MGSVGNDDALGALAQAVRRSGLVEPSSSGVVLVSGGADSACAAAGLAACDRAGQRARPARQLRPARVSRSRRARLPRPLLEAADRSAHRATQGAGRKPPGRGAGCALRRRRAAAGADRKQLDRDRAHADRPGRDGPLPPRRLAGSAGAPRPARPAAAASCGPLLELERVETRRLAAGQACRSPTTRPTSSSTSPATECAPRCCRCFTS